MVGAVEEQDAHCLELVRQFDKDRFLASLFLPDAVRPHALALYAFNIEIARVREIVSEPQIGEIRHQWWRDTLVSIYAGDVPAHPVAEALARAINAGELPQQLLRNMIEARTFDLYDDPMPTVNDLEGYLGETSSVLILLVARLLDHRQADAAAEAAGLAGVAYGITGLLRALPVHRARGQSYLPRDVLAAHGLVPSHILAGRDAEGLPDALAQLRGLARQRLAEARRAAVPQAVRGAFLPVSLVDLYLDWLDRLGVQALTEVANVSQLRRQIRLFRAARRGRF
jgi:phytoene synthase